jgi:hypothetical protein
MKRVRNIDRKTNRFPPFTVFMPMADDVADQVATIHTLGELRLDIVTDTNLNACQVGVDRGEDARLD